MAVWSDVFAACAAAMNSPLMKPMMRFVVCVVMMCIVITFGGFIPCPTM